MVPVIDYWTEFAVRRIDATRGKNKGTHASHCSVSWMKYGAFCTRTSSNVRRLTFPAQSTAAPISLQFQWGVPNILSTKHVCSACFIHIQKSCLVWVSANKCTTRVACQLLYRYSSSCLKHRSGIGIMTRSPCRSHHSVGTMIAQTDTM